MFRLYTGEVEALHKRMLWIDAFLDQIPFPWLHTLYTKALFMTLY